MLPPLSEEVSDDPGQQYQNDGQHHSGRLAESGLTVAENVIVDEHGGGLSRLHVSGNGHGIIEAAQAPCQQQRHVGGKGGNQQGQGHIGEALQGVGSVQGGGLVVVAGNCLQAGDIDQHTVAHIAPDGDDRHARNNLAGLTQGAGSAEENGINVGIYITPDNGGAGQSRGEGQEHHCPAGICEFGILEQQQRKRETQHVGSDVVDDGKGQGVHKRLLEIGVLQHQNVVVQAVELFFVTDNAFPVCKGIGNALKKGDQYHISKQGERGEQEQQVGSLRFQLPGSAAAGKLIVFRIFHSNSSESKPGDFSQQGNRASGLPYRRENRKKGCPYPKIRASIVPTGKGKTPDQPFSAMFWSNFACIAFRHSSGDWLEPLE